MNEPISKKVSFDELPDLDIRLSEVINSFISSSERPTFLIRDDTLLYMNQSARAFLDIGFDKEFVGHNFFKLIDKDDRFLLSANIGEMITEGKIVKIKFKNDKDKVASINLQAIYLPESDHFSFILLGEHIKKNYLASYNNLYNDITGLPNFFLFEDRVQVAISGENAEEKASDGSIIAVGVINIDNIEVFRKMHIEDMIIKRVANNLVLNLPKNTTIAMGLKYHFWFMVSVKGELELKEKINSVLTVLREGVSDNFTKHDLLFSVGVSLFPQNARSTKNIMEQAIKALEKARQCGNNRLEYFEKEKVSV